MLRYARRRAGLTQKALGGLANVPQPAIARIERGSVSPRVDTLEALLRAAGQTLSTEPVLGMGIDRAQIRELLQLSPAERLRLAVADARGLAGLRPERRAREA